MDETKAEHEQRCPLCNRANMLMISNAATAARVVIELLCSDCDEVSTILIECDGSRVMYGWADSKHSKAVATRRNNKRKVKENGAGKGVPIRNDAAKTAVRSKEIQNRNQ